MSDPVLVSVSQMEQLNLAWTIFGALKALGVEPSDYPPVNAWMAKTVLAGMTPVLPSGQHHEVWYIPLTRKCADSAVSWQMC